MKSLLRSIIQPGTLLLALASLPLSADNVVENAGAPTLTHRTERLEKSRGARDIEGASRLQVVGAIEVDTNFSSDDSGGISIATVELGLDANPTGITQGHFLVLFEEGSSDAVGIDEAIITLTSAQTSWSLVTGRLRIPSAPCSPIH